MLPYGYELNDNTQKVYWLCGLNSAFLSRAFSSCRILTSAKATCFPASKVLIQTLLNVLSFDAQADSSCLRCARSRNNKRVEESSCGQGTDSKAADQPTALH